MPPFSTNDSHEFKPILAEIEDSPVSPLGRLTFYLILITFLFFVGWMIIGQIDIVVSSVAAKVIPVGEVKIVQPLDTGSIARILVKEGDFVHKGQPLMEIDPSSTEPEVASNKKNLEYANLEASRIKSELKGEKFSPPLTADAESVSTQRDLYTASVNNLSQQLKAKQEELKRTEQSMNSSKVDRADNEALLKASQEKETRLKDVLDLIARDDYEKVETDIVSYRDKITQAEFKLTELQHQRQQTVEEIGHIEQEYRNTNLKDLSEKQKQATELDAKLKQTYFKNAKQKIVAPVDGHVDTLFIHTVGGVVTPAEKLLSIVPSTAPIVVQASVSSKDIGFVEKEMPVQIKVDTFDFQKYGMFQGKVTLVSRDSKDDEKLGTIYQVYVTPTTPYLLVEGKKQTLTSGMSVVAEIKVGKRRIIEFFIYPLVKYLHEGMSVR